MSDPMDHLGAGHRRRSEQPILLDVNGATMAVHEKGAGRPVVFLHGRGGSAWTWRRQLDRLYEEFRAIAFDSRGVGRSTLGQRPYTLRTLADDVAGLVTALDLDRVTLVGLSMGGGIAQAVALHHPDKVAALVLVSTSSEFPQSTRDRFRREADEVERDGISAALAARMAAKWFSDAYRSTHPDEVAEVVQQVMKLDPHVFAMRCRLNAERDLTGAIGSIACPVRFIGGSEDPMDAAAQARRYQQYLPQCAATVIDGVSHCLHLETPDVFNSLLREFVRSLTD